MRDTCIFVCCLALDAIVYAARGQTVYALCDTYLRAAYAARLQHAVQPLAGWAALVAIAQSLVGWALSITVAQSLAGYTFDLDGSCSLSTYT
jgi:hypothetical protein